MGKKACGKQEVLNKRCADQRETTLLSILCGLNGQKLSNKTTWYAKGGKSITEIIYYYNPNLKPLSTSSLNKF